MNDKTDIAAHNTTFQARVQPWMLACFGEMIAGEREERNHRFLEEALELVQSTGCTASEAHQLVDYVYGRPVGEPVQEVGGVMVTLAALCLANSLDMHTAAETELARIWTKVEQIRAKQAAKPRHLPLPAAPASSPQGAGAAAEDLPPLLELDTQADMEHLFSTPPDWDEDYRNTWKKLQVAERNKMQWRAYALKLFAILATRPRAPAISQPAARVTAPDGGFEAWARSEGLIQESHGIMLVSFMCDVARKAWHAALGACPPADAAPVDAKLREAVLRDGLLETKEVFQRIHGAGTIGPARDWARIAMLEVSNVLARHAAQPSTTQGDVLDELCAAFGGVRINPDGTFTEDSIRKLLEVVRSMLGPGIVLHQRQGAEAAMRERAWFKDWLAGLDGTLSVDQVEFGRLAWTERARRAAEGGA